MKINSYAPSKVVQDRTRVRPIPNPSGQRVNTAAKFNREDENYGPQPSYNRYTAEKSDLGIGTKTQEDAASNALLGRGKQNKEQFNTPEALAKRIYHGK